MRFKRGTTFAYAGTFPVADAGGNPVDLTGWFGQSQLRRADATAELVEDLSFQWLDPAAQTFVIRAADTTLWPLATLEIDVVLTSPTGERIASSTTKITVEREVTK